MKEIYVGLSLGGQMEPVGVIRFDESVPVGVFAYLPSYAGPPLDPINLDYRSDSSGSSIRLGPRMFGVDPKVCPGLIHGVFQDALPGAWGMLVLRTEYPQLRGMKDAQLLHWFGSRTVGALSFFVRSPADETPVAGIEALHDVRRKSEEFQRTMLAMGLLGVKNPALASHGGVMPKASYVDNEGVEWLAKFAPAGQGRQYTSLEYLACQMARLAGVSTPDTDIVDVPGSDDKIFLTRRFDRQDGARTHRISMYSLLRSAKVADPADGDYRMIFETLRRLVPQEEWPAQATEMLRRMAFGIGLNVLDDHLRNHEMTYEEGRGWRLAPAFDLVPEPAKSPHHCGIFGHPRASLDLAEPKSQEIWNKVADELGMERKYVHQVVISVRTAIATYWPSLVEGSALLNRYNKLAAHMAADIGCGMESPVVEAARHQAALARAGADGDRPSEGRNRGR